MQAGKLTVRPYMPIVAFAYITGWRTPSEILTLEWHQVDLEAGEVRVDPGTTKNGRQVF